MIEGLHHYHRRKGKVNLERDSLKRIADAFIYFGGIVGPLVTIPQLMKIWYEKTALGVSAVSWGGYLLGAIFWLGYGIIHKEKPIIFTYGVWVVLDLLILFGIFLYG